MLTREAGQPWDIYKGVSPDPVPGAHAVIDSLTLLGNASYSMSHDQDANAYLSARARSMRSVACR